MAGEPFGLILKAAGVMCFNEGKNVAVRLDQSRPCQTNMCDLAHHGMSEVVFDFRRDTGLDQEVGGNSLVQCYRGAGP